MYIYIYFVYVCLLIERTEKEKTRTHMFKNSLDRKGKNLYIYRTYLVVSLLSLLLDDFHLCVHVMVVMFFSKHLTMQDLFEFIGCFWTFDTNV